LWLKREAQRLLEAETRTLAARLGREVVRVTVRDPRSRWGSCSSAGAISYSWRLILAPEFVRRAVVAHEVAHLAEPNHGPGFWKLAEALLGDPQDDARAWLRAHGRGLHAWGREG
ncbi:MAG: M48 family metallopeptidase, partial [Thermaurantiacus sp.]